MMSKIIILIFICYLFKLDTKAQYSDSTETVIDSLDYSSSGNILADSNRRQLKRVPVINEALVGIASGVISALAMGTLSIAVIQPSGEMGGLIAIPFAYLGFIVGSSTGMYLVVHMDNPNISWGLINLSGLLGAAGGFGMSRLLPKNNLVPMLIVPLLFELIYANLLVPDSEENLSFQNNKDYQVFTGHKVFNLYEQSKIFEVNVITISF